MHACRHCEYGMRWAVRQSPLLFRNSDQASRSCVRSLVLLLPMSCRCTHAYMKVCCKSGTTLGRSQQASRAFNRRSVSLSEGKCSQCETFYVDVRLELTWTENPEETAIAITSLFFENNPTLFVQPAGLFVCLFDLSL